jgi:hypothetical protein
LITRKLGLEDIEKAAHKIAGDDIEFKMTALAEEYYETRRLQHEQVAINS